MKNFQSICNFDLLVISGKLALYGGLSHYCLLLWWLSAKETTCNAEDACLIPELGRSPEEGNDNPSPVFLLGNTMDRGAMQATVHGVAGVRKDLRAKPSPPQLLLLTHLMKPHLFFLNVH